MEQYHPVLSLLQKQVHQVLSNSRDLSLPKEERWPSPDVNLWTETEVPQASYRVNKSKMRDNSPWVSGVSACLASKVLMALCSALYF